MPGKFQAAGKHRRILERVRRNKTARLRLPMVPLMRLLVMTMRWCNSQASQHLPMPHPYFQPLRFILHNKKIIKHDKKIILQTDLNVRHDEQFF